MEDKDLHQRIGLIERQLKSIQFEEIVLHLQNTKRLIWRSFLGGIFRGIGAFIGFIALFILLGWLLTLAMRGKIPWLASWIADLLDHLGRAPKQ